MKQDQLNRYDTRKSQESESKGAEDAQPHHSPTRLDDLLVGDSPTKIPDQVADSVEAVVGERKSHKTLEKNLGNNGKSSESSGHGGRLQMPAKQRRGEVCSRVKIQRTRKGESGNTVKTTADPSDLGAVDGKVRGNGTVQTLLRKDLGRVRGVRGSGSLSGCLN